MMLLVLNSTVPTDETATTLGYAYLSQFNAQHTATLGGLHLAAVKAAKGHKGPTQVHAG